MLPASARAAVPACIWRSAGAPSDGFPPASAGACKPCCSGAPFVGYRMTLWTFCPLPLLCLQEVQHELEAETNLLAAVRGHLLMQLQARAAAQGWSGAPAELQRGLLPLACMADGGLHGGERPLEELFVLACSEVGWC